MTSKKFIKYSRIHGQVEGQRQINFGMQSLLIQCPGYNMFQILVLGLFIETYTHTHSRLNVQDAGHKNFV